MDSRGDKLPAHAADLPPRNPPLPHVNHWLIKQEPTAYAWAQFVKDGGTTWTGVRNFQARNNLRAMRRGDLVLYYHSVVGKEIVGIAKVAAAAYPDPTAEDGDWVCVDLIPQRALKAAVTLDMIKASKPLAGMVLLRNSRLSVQPVSAAEFKAVVQLSE